MTVSLLEDVEAVNKIPIIPTLLEVVCSVTGIGFAAVARVTDKQRIACAVRDEIAFGLKPGEELKIETTLCQQVKEKKETIVIDNVNVDPRFADHVSPKTYGYQSYISVPIVLQDGEFFGTLCAIDPKPITVNNNKTVGMFRLFAPLISFHLHSMDELADTESKLSGELEVSRLREQFIAFLGHDLRNPLGAVSSSVQLLSRISTDETSVRLLSIVKTSVYRMNGLIENILDFARGRIGEGIRLNRQHAQHLVTVLSEVIAEIETMNPQREIKSSFDLNVHVFCDVERIAQLFSNLLGNAVSHGTAETPIIVKAAADNQSFRLSVSNSGAPIPAAVMDRLFQPYSRGEVKPGQDGLGLGLYIASEIARAHGGSFVVLSTADETRFTFSMPMAG